MSSEPTKPRIDAPAAEPVTRARHAGWMPRKRHVITSMVIVLLGLYAHRENLGGLKGILGHPERSYAMMGFDAYMQIIAARIQSPQDFLDTFTEELTNGRIEADFYRPVQNLTIALDYAVWGLEPFGYHLSTFVAFAACIALVYACTRRILGPNAWIGPTVAALFFALHPSLLNVLPSPARRSDILVIVFLLLTLFVLPVTQARRTWPRILATGFLVMIAAGAKDIGVMGLGLVFIHQFFFRFGGGVGRSLWRAWMLSLPAAIGAGLYLINRTIVLRGFGGYSSTDEIPYTRKLQEFGAEALVDLLCPWIFWPREWMPEDWRQIHVAILSGCLILVLAAVFILVAMASRSWDRQRAGILACLGLAWLIPPAILLGAMNWYGPWYTLLPTAGIALILGAVSQGTCSLLRGRWFERALGVGPALLIPLAMLLPLWYSPLRVHYWEWQRGSKSLRATLDDLDRQVAVQDKKGDDEKPFVFVSPLPHYVDTQPPPDRPRLTWVSTIMVKGLQAYAELRYPDRPVRAVYTHSPTARFPQKPNELLIRVRYADLHNR